ncbi:IS1595 family transposase [Haloarcula sp. Atlit-7R]|uniref:IS1595 family transposase n=1 Tax=Haloarcula sp. Atlit-7R TaxID=2282125 RepID=UPI000EF16755|nr:IS1595 family transposase [Haloarcula sp. Atlit-7R]RLM95317.1 IS1595 family transposase [Haloarcula sp. Atlit-7R]
MFPMSRFVSESAAADLLQQVRWRDGVECPRCRSDLTVRNGSYRVYQRYLCKNCGRTFNDKTGTIFAHSKLNLKEWYFTIYVFLRFKTSLRQIEVELDCSYRTVRRHVERFARALDAPAIRLSGPVEIDEVYVSAGLKGRERDQKSRSRGLSTRGRGSYAGDKPPVFTLVDRGSDERYVVPAKSADESTVRLLLADHEQESLTVYTDGFRADDALEDDDEFDREYVVHGDGEYADGDVHVNGCESHASLTRRWLSPHRSVSKDKLTPYLRAFELRRELYRKPGDEALKHALDAAL